MATISPAEGETLLFPSSLLPSRESLNLSEKANGIEFRPLSRSDYVRGFYECLGVLTWVGNPTEAEFHQRFDEMRDSKGTYHFVVAVMEEQIVGTGCLVVERKFIHNHGAIGHVEEIAIAKEHQGKGLGLAMMNVLDKLAITAGCYKSILNCGPRTEQFYTRCGYHNSGIEMSRYFEEAQDSYHRG
ncbi:glucosamine 6-phosphate N-acetyltransferase [Xylariaceae sp. FL0255]|nr:glucosamine 6-phosphate N-acetyltransferase [Xylariaceae sp. FL0255]